MLDKIIHTTSALGIPIRFSLGWLVSVALYTWLLGAFCFPALMPGINPALSYSLGLANTLLVFAGVLAHELGHALAARRHGTRVEGINMGLLGGGARLYGDARTPIDGLRYALSGPAVTGVIAVCWLALGLLLYSSAPAAITATITYQLLMSVLALIFNLLPVYSLDGARVLRSLLWLCKGTKEPVEIITAKMWTAL